MALLASCTEEDYKLYDTTQKDSVFFEYKNDRNELVDSVEYAFNFDVAQSHTIEIPITLMGVPKDYDREVKVVAVADESDMVEGKNYTITNNIIAANAVSGTVHVNLLRDKDPELLSKVKTVKLTIEEGDDLKPVGNNFMKVKYSDIRPDIRPDWWNTGSALPVYSYENGQLFFEYFYRLAPAANLDVFNEMISVYGDYFVNAVQTQGPLTMYTNFLRQFVLIPMYNENPGLEWYESPLW